MYVVNALCCPIHSTQEFAKKVFFQPMDYQVDLLGQILSHPSEQGICRSVWALCGLPTTFEKLLGQWWGPFWDMPHIFKTAISG